jgi:carbon monoxide dehydrogenase subunit G
MELQNSFVVPADVDTAWQALLDVEKIAPCMPGAALTKVEGDTFEGTVKVKLGPVSMTYGGVASFLEKDADAHRAVIEGTGKESRGSGTAKAIVTTQLISETPSTTRVEVSTDLVITGKPAQFGRGVMQDVAGRIVDQFAANLAAVIADNKGPAAAASAGQAVADGDPTMTTPTVLPQAADSIDLLGTAGAPVLKRVIPVVAGVIVLGVVIWLIVRNRG